MPNFRPVDRNLKFIAVDFEAQILPDTFEHAVSVLVDQELDLTPFIETYRNDETGATAYDPRVMLKIVLLGYSRGLISSRAIERACRDNVVFMALSGDQAPAYTGSQTGSGLASCLRSPVGVVSPHVPTLPNRVSRSRLPRHLAW